MRYSVRSSKKCESKLCSLILKNKKITLIDDTSEVKVKIIYLSRIHTRTRELSVTLMREYFLRFSDSYKYARNLFNSLQIYICTPI